MLQHWIWFARCERVSNHTKQTLLQRFRDPEDIFHADEAAFADIPEMTEAAVAALMEKDLTEAAEILQACSRKGIHVLTYLDECYPPRLRNIYDPPMVLYFKGILPDWETRPVIGIVGTRKASIYGMNTAKQFGRQISACGAIVVSGCATGIDGMAMEGALETGNPVVGILGGGVDVIYPAKNRSLFSALETGGCLISEYPPGDRPVGWHFPLRNRIITGLSNGLLVVEAPERSGALISARHAMEQGRDVFVVPGNVGVETCAGSNQLLEEQALPALSGWHVLREYEAMYPDTVCKRDIPARRENYGMMVAQEQQIPFDERTGKEPADKKSIDKEEKCTYSVVNNPSAALNADEQHILAHIGTEPGTVDDVIAKADMAPGTVKSILTKLIIKGLVRNLPGGRVSRK